MSMFRPYYQDEDWVVPTNICLNSGFWPASGLTKGGHCECGFKCKIKATYKLYNRDYILTVKEFLEIKSINNSRRNGENESWHDNFSTREGEHEHV